jgi:hypothetical protein
MNDALFIMNNRVNSEATNIIRKFNDVVPEPTSRRKIFHYIQGTTVDDKLNYSSTGRILTKKI